MIVSGLRDELTGWLVWRKLLLGFIVLRRTIGFIREEILRRPHTVVGARHIEAYHWIELLRLLEDFHPVSVFVFLRYEWEVAIVAHDLLGCFELLSLHRLLRSVHTHRAL